MSAHPTQRFRWTWALRAAPEALWPLVSNTDRFNRDCGYPPVEVLPPPADRGRATNTRRLRAHVMGLVIAWDEQAFEWLAPARYSVERDYLSGPVARMVMRCELHPRPDGGTTLVYAMELTPANVFGRLALPYSIGRQAHAATERVFRRYDEFALQGMRSSELAQKPRLAPGGDQRLAALRSVLAAAVRDVASVDRLLAFVTSADDLSVARLQAYALADRWRADRRATLQLCLHATRAGLLDFRWELICPHCRGAKATPASLGQLKPAAHCDTCHIDFTANFDQSVELAFSPNPAVRSVLRSDYCVGGPQNTPHVVAQQNLAPGETRVLPLALAPGRYRVRSPDVPEQHAFRVADDAAPRLRLDLAAKPLDEPAVRPVGEILLVNAGAAPRLAIIEHLAWSDQSTTAAEVTSLQLFRDLFSAEVLRRGEQISVGSMTVVFTDLKDSTRLYQEIGDAPAFGRVLTHFEILKIAVAQEGGAIVKTMGDAIMAVFPRPVSALRALIHAQRWLAHPAEFTPPEDALPDGVSLRPLRLKAGVHCGPCLVINQNDRLDYFGSTVNFAARLCGLCTGADLILSAAVSADPEIAAHLVAAQPPLAATPEHTTLRGFGDTAFEVCRVIPGAVQPADS